MQYVKSNDGTKLAVYDKNSRSPKTVFLIHGWPLSHKIFEYQLPMLLSCGYRVVTMDLRGFGRSDVPANGYTYDQMAADISAVIRQLGLHHVVLVGFSMGGAIALRYMRRYRGFGVRKLILLSAAAPCFAATPNCPDGMPFSSVNALIELAERDRPQLCLNFSKQLFARPHSAILIDWFRNISLSASGIGTVQCAIALRDEDCTADLESIRVPTAILHGKEDQIVSSALAQMQCEMILNPQCYTLANSGHCIVYDELESFNALFLTAVLN